MMVLHYTGMDDTEDAMRRLCAAAPTSPAHYVVLEDGYILQLVTKRGVPGTRA